MQMTGTAHLQDEASVHAIQQGQHKRRQAADLSQVVKVHSVVGRPKSHEVAVCGAELHAADIGFAVNASHCAVISDAPQAHCAVVTAAQKACGVSLHITWLNNENTYSSKIWTDEDSRCRWWKTKKMACQNAICNAVFCEKKQRQVGGPLHSCALCPQDISYCDSQ